MTDGVLEPTAIARLQRIGGTRLVRQLIEMYVALGPERIAALRDGVASSDAQRVERAAHTLKSTAGNLGAVQLQHTAQSLETAAAEGTVDPALAALCETQYHDAVAALQRALEELEE